MFYHVNPEGRPVSRILQPGDWLIANESYALRIDDMAVDDGRYWAERPCLAVVCGPVQIPLLIIDAYRRLRQGLSA